MSDCLFCRIGSGDVPASVVHRDDAVLAFRDVNPQAPTHLLVIPLTHVGSVLELTAAHHAVWAQMLLVAQELAVSEGVDRSGFRLVTNTGPDAGQSVHHLHLHLLGGRQLEWPPG